MIKFKIFYSLPYLMVDLTLFTLSQSWAIGFSLRKRKIFMSIWDKFIAYNDMLSS